MNEPVVVIIPVYKKCLSEYEMISLRQADQMLSAYPKMYVAPESLKFNYGISYNAARFPDQYFINTNTYSELLLSEKFYRTFIGYEYMLIYQLDAFVFKDELKKFCDMKYDYIGAPVQGGNWSNYHVGNGGLSLRKIDKCIQILKEKDKLVKKIRGEKLEEYAEDLFWGFCGNAKDIDFNVPSPRIANLFSVQSDYVRGLRDIKKRGLPFGCHYWWKMNYDFWKPYIESYGYKLPAIENSPKVNLINLTRLMYLLKRYIRNCCENREIESVYKHMPLDRKYSIYCAGKVGCMCIDFFRSLPINYYLEKIFDKKIRGDIRGINIDRPDDKIIRKKETYIIIASVKYKKDISVHLSKCGLREWEDYCAIDDLCYEMLGDSRLYNKLSGLVDLFK